MTAPGEKDSAQPVLVRTMCPSPEGARNLARDIVRARLASAAHVSKRKSFYWWEDVFHEQAEWELICVTRHGRFGEIKEMIHAAHPYDLPELIVIPIAETSGPYSEWILQYTG